MQKDTAHEGRVGKPTLSTLADAPATLKKFGGESQPPYFDNNSEDGDDFGEMVPSGLRLASARDFRKLANGLDGIRAIARVLNAFETEKCGLADAGPGQEQSYTVISPRTTNGLLDAIAILAECLSRDTYSLAHDITRDTAKGGAQ
ncbi:hypothetical protein [Cupriavidus basilensis]|uniref:hypothetical protein n=1 Tax=Cupriavidus basilensis TaxID=68895 RepID=UPI00157B0CBC|nr:hypothetical protein [Cupriavidus basilensis]NUA26133.1 hypothetical protein [Cupriavidus basilensis]